MSGVAGGHRIKVSEVEAVVQNFATQVLRKFPEFADAMVISGSHAARKKKDCGDIDLIVQFNAKDKNALKKKFASFVASLPDDVTIPFQSQKYYGRKFYNSGEIVTVLFPQSFGNVQIDVIFALNQKELLFKKEFLNMTAEKQGLVLGLVKTVCIEHDSPLSGTGIAPFGLNANEELEFNLSSTRLELRTVQLEYINGNPTEISRESIESWTDWSKVEWILRDYDLTRNFSELLLDANYLLTNPRSFKRIVGLFKSMVSVKSGEEGTPKADAKNRAIKAVDAIMS